MAVGSLWRKSLLVWWRRLFPVAAAAITPHIDECCCCYKSRSCSGSRARLEVTRRAAVVIKAFRVLDTSEIGLVETATSKVMRMVSSYTTLVVETLFDNLPCDPGLPGPTTEGYDALVV